MRPFLTITLLFSIPYFLYSQMYLAGPAIPTPNQETSMYWNTESNEWYLSIYIDASHTFEDFRFKFYSGTDTIDIGGNILPTGTGEEDGPFFILPHDGFYLVRIKESTYEYSISDGSAGINTLNPRASLEVFGSMFSTAHYIEADSSHILVPQNINTVVITGSRPDSVIVLLNSSFADGQRILIQNWCYPKAVVPLSVSSVTIEYGECAEFINTSYTGIRRIGESKSLSTSEVWLTGGNFGVSQNQSYLGTRDSSDLNIKTSDITRAVITANGNIGIGNYSPVGKFQINAMANPGFPTINLVDSASTNANGPYIQFSNIFQSNNLQLLGNFGASPDGSDSYFRFSRNHAPLMSLRGDGNLGIGTGEPTSKVSISSIIGNQLSLQNSNALDIGVSSSIHFGGSNYSTGFISTLGQSTSNARMGFFTGYTFTGGPSFMLERVSISNTGNVGIGITNPGQKLEVGGNIKIQDGALQIYENTENVATISSQGSLQIKGRANIGDDVSPPQTGAVRWNENNADFEGYNGTEWVSFTRKGGGWGHELFENSTVSTSETDSTGLHYYGRSIDIYGDRVIVGAPARDVGSNLNQGKAYIFVKSDNSWELEDIITASDGDELDFFGVSVAMHGDYAIVGASTKQVGTYENMGKVYFFKRTGSTWNEEYNQAPFDGYSNDYFGSSVDIYNDYAVVGSPWKDLAPANTFQTEHGKIYIFQRSGTAWNLIHDSTAPDNESGDRFGYSVSLDSLQIIVGAPEKDNHGKVYILNEAAGSWTHTIGFTASDNQTGDSFGESVHLYKNTAIIGNPSRSVPSVATYSGKAYIYNKVMGNWVETAGITASDMRTNDLFGSSVSLFDNYALIGAKYNNNSSFKPGKAYIFTFNGSTWLESKKLLPTQSQDNDDFGGAVSISFNHAFVGASRYNVLQGKVFYYKK